MSPLHHHFELSGWDEEKITLRFWIVAVLAALLGVMLFLASVNRLREMTVDAPTTRPLDPDALTLDGIRAAARGPTRHRARLRAHRGRAGRFLADPGRP